MTHKKLILMALMGVMLSDADAGARRAKQVSPKAHKIGSRGRARSALRGNVVTDAGGAQGGQNDDVFDDDTDTNLAQQHQERMKKTQVDPEATQPVAQKPDYEAKKDFGAIAQRAFGVKPNDTLGNFLKSVLGVQDLNNIKGLNKKLDGFVALGESDAKLKENVMTGTMLGVLGLASGKTLQDMVVKMGDVGSSDTALEISIGTWKPVNIEKGGQKFNGANLDTSSGTGEVDAALDALAATSDFTKFFDGFNNIGLLVGDELKDVGLGEFDKNDFKTDMLKILESKKVIKDDGKFEDKKYAITASMKEYVNNKWVKPLFDNIKKYVDGDKPVFAVYVDADDQVTKNPKETFSKDSNVKTGMRFVPADNKKALLNLARIKKGDKTIFNVVLADIKTDVTMNGDTFVALAKQLQDANARIDKEDVTFSDILADPKGVETLAYAQELLGTTPKVKGGTVDQAKFMAKLDELFSGHRTVKKAKNAKNDKDRKAAEKELEKNLAKIVGALVDRAYTESKGPGRFDTKVAESSIG